MTKSICDACETVSHCMKKGCIPITNPEPTMAAIKAVQEVSDAEVFAIFRANCLHYSGNYEVTPGFALRIAMRILALRSGASK